MAGKTRTSFSKDKPGPGRPAGVPNKKNRDVAEAYEKILTDADYRAALKRRLIRGTAGAMEVTMHHYVYGKPKETVVHEGAAAFRGLSTAELAARAMALAQRLGGK